MSPTVAGCCHELQIGVGSEVCICILVRWWRGLKCVLEPPVEMLVLEFVSQVFLETFLCLLYRHEKLTSFHISSRSYQIL